MDQKHMNYQRIWIRKVSRRIEIWSQNMKFDKYSCYLIKNVPYSYVLCSVQNINRFWNEVEFFKIAFRVNTLNCSELIKFISIWKIVSLHLNKLSQIMILLPVKSLELVSLELLTSSASLAFLLIVASLMISTPICLSHIAKSSPMFTNSSQWMPVSYNIFPSNQGSFSNFSNSFTLYT